jgi:hypothetical protein
MTLARRDLSFYEEASGSWRLDSGRFNLLVGPTSRDIRLRSNVDVVR